MEKEIPSKRVEETTRLTPEAVAGLMPKVVSLKMKLHALLLELIVQEELAFVTSPLIKKESGTLDDVDADCGKGVDPGAVDAAAGVATSCLGAEFPAAFLVVFSCCCVDTFRSAFSWC